MAQQIIYALAVPLFVLIVCIIERRSGQYVAGIIQGIPAISFPIFLILTLYQPIEFMRTAALFGAIGTIPWILYIQTYRSISVMFSPTKSYFISSLVWAASSLALLLSKGYIFALLVFFSAIYVLFLIYKEVVFREKAPIGSKNPILARVIFSAIIAIAVLFMSSKFDGSWSGIILAFPAAASTLLFFNHLHGSQTDVVQIAQGLTFGVIPLSSFMITSYVLMFFISAPLSLLCAVIISVAITLIMVSGAARR